MITTLDVKSALKLKKIKILTEKKENDLKKREKRKKI